MKKAMADAGLKALLTKFSDAKGKILRALWPCRWVSSSKLLKLTNQKYFDRRIRELRDESGFDIETGYASGKAAYRLVSHTARFEESRRQYPNSQERAEVIKRDGVRCNICGFIPPTGKITGYLQYDHRIPFHERNGETNVDNLQLVCIRCNVIKKRACQICPMVTCNNCPYAYSEKFGGIYVIGISKQAKGKYESVAKLKNIKIEDAIRDVIED